VDEASNPPAMLPIDGHRGVHIRRSGSLTAMDPTTPTLLSIQVGMPREFGGEEADDPMESPWSTGSYKEPVAGPVYLRRTNLDGDGQADLTVHGGPDKAVCCYPAGHYPGWQRDLNLPEFSHGAFGENFTLRGMTEADVCIGDVWQVGGATVEVSQPRQPCWKLARRWKINDLTRRVQKSGLTGWYFRVLTEGLVAPGLPLTLVARPSPAWTIERANRVMAVDKKDRALAAELAAVPGLSESWKAAMRKRAASGIEAETGARLDGGGAAR
jgi:MOSC domain-containing protein YiiM